LVGSLIKVSFWLFLLILSLSIDRTLYGDRLARVTSDPFGLHASVNAFRGVNADRQLCANNVLDPTSRAPVAWLYL
jgi:hypothetical protein